MTRDLDRVPGAAPSRAPSRVPVGAPQLEGYELLGQLPASRAATVYSAIKSGAFGGARKVAVKWISRARSNYDEDARVLLDEARAIALLDHPNIIRLVDAGETAEGAFLSVDLVDGTDLRRINQMMWAKADRLPVELSLYVVLSVLRGLDHAHRACSSDGTPLELVHRDVNPANVLVSRSAHVVLADFAMVRMRNRAQAPTTPGLIKGKLGYLAPEYVLEQKLSPRTDIYSAGVILFELLAGAPWMSGLGAARPLEEIVNEGLPMRLLDETGTPYELRGIVSLATEREPSRRFASAAEMIGAIEAWLIQRGTYVSPSTFASYLVARGLLG